MIDHLYRWLPVWLPIYWVAGVIGVVLACLGAASVLDEFRAPLFVALTVMLLLGLGLPLVYVRLPPLFFFPARRRAAVWRKRLAALFSVRYGLGPGGLGLLLEDDDRCSYYLQRFLSEHQVPYTLPLYDQKGAYLFAAPAKVKVLAESLLRAVGRGHDNELYVLLVDLLELSDALEPLLRSVKVALARHHRVTVVCSWPPGIPPPIVSRGKTEDDEILGTDGIETSDGAVRSVLQQTTTKRFHRAFGLVRKAFGRIGVAVICAQAGDPPRIILGRLELLRGLGRRR